MKRSMTFFARFFACVAMLSAQEAKTGNVDQVPAQAEGRAIAGTAIAIFPRAFGAGVFIDTFPMFSLSNRRPVSTPHDMTASELYEFADRPAFLSAGFTLSLGRVATQMVIELHQDSGEYLLGASWSNLPLKADGSGIIDGYNFPQVGYVAAQGEGWNVSAGRRRLGFGPGEYGLTVSAHNPFHDHVLASLYAPLGRATIGYNFAAINTQRYEHSNLRLRPQKNLFMHRIFWSYGNFSAALGEANLVVGDNVDLADIGPFLVYHHLFKEHSNVMLDFEFGWQPAKNIDIYGEAVVDDFQTAGEGSISNPNAMGFMLGAEWTIRAASRTTRPAFFHSDRSLRVSSLDFSELDDSLEGGATGSGWGELRSHDRSAAKGGLKARIEAYLASTYLYRRRINDSVLWSEEETFRNRYMFQNCSDLGWQTVEPYFADPLEPDTALFRLELSWAEGRTESSIGLDYTISGSQSDEPYYGDPPYPAAWLGPSGPVRVECTAIAKVIHSPDANSAIMGEARLAVEPEKITAALSLGYGIRLGTGITPRR